MQSYHMVQTSGEREEEKENQMGYGDAIVFYSFES